MSTTIDTQCLAKCAPRGAGQRPKWGNTGKTMKHFPEAMIDSCFAKTNDLEADSGLRLDGEAFRAALQKRANAPLYIPSFFY